MKVFIIAGEPSGDSLGGALMAGLRALSEQVRFEGVGGARMQAEGLQSLFPMEELSLMGIAEILPKYRHLKWRIQMTAQAVIDARPDVLITIDSPDFCLRVARAVKARSTIRTVHYVAPTVWAWRPKRAERMAKVIDHVLALLPFEPPYMQAAGMECDFVGHPIATEPDVTEQEKAAFKARHDIGEGPVLAVLAGSRRSEVQRLGPVFARACAQVSDVFGTVLVPTLPHLVEQLEQAMPHHGGGKRSVIAGEGVSSAHAARDRLVAMACADVALAASGTVSLELALARTPMVIAYDFNWLTRIIMRRMVVTDTVTLVNLVSETRVVPEFLLAECQPDAIAASLRQVHAEPEAQLAALDLTMDRLGRGGEACGLRAARAALARM